MTDASTERMRRSYFSTPCICINDGFWDSRLSCLCSTSDEAISSSIIYFFLAISHVVMRRCELLHQGLFGLSRRKSHCVQYLRPKDVYCNRYLCDITSKQ